MSFFCVTKMNNVLGKLLTAITHNNIIPRFEMIFVLKLVNIGVTMIIIHNLYYAIS